MKSFTIKITGNTEGDIDLAIDEVASKIKQGFESGFDMNESGSFHFESEGEYDKDECLVDSDGCLIDNDGDAETDMENRLEQQRRDEKNGLYPEKWDDAN